MWTPCGAVEHALAPGPQKIAVAVEHHHRMGAAVEDIDVVVPVDADRGDVGVEFPAIGQLGPIIDDLVAEAVGSRRGAHLWIFADKPLLARDCRIYIYNLALRLKVPVKGGSGLAEGIEIFPRQDQLDPGEFGNAIRGPLGVHRATVRRYWFYGADYHLEAQLEYLERLRKITEPEIMRFIAGLEMPEEFRPRPKIELPPYDPTRREFRILDHVRPTRKRSGNYWARCPSCAEQGRDQGGDNLAISVADPRKYKCWAGCPKEMIRAAVGHPIRVRRQVENEPSVSDAQ